MELSYTGQIRISIFLKVLSYLEGLGYSAEAICSAANLNYSQMQRVKTKVSEEEADLLWHQALKISGIQDLGFQAGRIYTLELFGLLGMILQNSNDIGEAIENACKFAIIATPAIRLKTSTTTEYTVIELWPSPPTSSYNAERIKQVCLYILGMLHKTYTLLTIRTDITMQLFLPKNFNIVAPLDGCFLVQKNSSGSPAYVIRFDKKYAATRVINSNPVIQSFLLKKAQEVLENKSRLKWSTKVKKVLLQNFDGNFLDIQTIASKFTISTRTLQRYLNAEKTNYQSIVNDVKFQLAQHYLDQGLSVKETAFNLGFKNQSNFSRAFKKWSGRPATG